jgi:lambda family phage tail tape measure protein
MGRQALGGMSTYAADISKQEIALKGITKTQQEYAKALAASAAVTRDFNVPQLEATRGITQLSAAVIGAGGKVADAEVVFRNVTAAIKASGGTSEDVQGALTALGQIFSKGKVSAEELQGQLGERLPGAVTMFAKATGRTLPQLQKDLEQGVVGLADLMKFVVSDQGLGQFEQGAKRVASSSADAGARLTATWNDTRRAIGEALLPLGAEIQDSLGNALRDATPALIDLAKALAETVKLLVDNAGAIATVAKVILGISTVAAAGFGFVKAAALIGTVTTAVTQLGGAMGVATLATRGLSVAMLGIPGIGWIGAAIAGLGLLAKAVYDTNDTFRNWVDNIGGVIANDFKAAINGMKEDAKSVFDFVGDLLPNYEEKTAKSQANVSDGWTSTFASIRDGALGFVTDIQNAFAGLFDTLPPWARKLLVDNAAGTSAGLVLQIANYAKGASERAAQGKPFAMGTEFIGPGGAPGKTSLPEGVLTRWETTQQQKKDKEDKDRLRQAQQQQQTDEALAKARIALDDAVHRNAMELIRKRYEYEQELAGKQRDNWVKSLTGAARSAGGLISGFLGEFDQLDNRLVQSQQDVSSAAQKLKSAQAMSSVTVGGTGSAGVGFSSSQLQAAAREASKFTGIANMCSESVKAFYKSLGISLPGVTAWADTVRKAGQVMTDWSKLQPGDIVATGKPGDTPHVGVYTGGDSVFHQSRSRGLTAGNYPDLNYFKQGGYFVRPSAMGGGAGAAARRDISAEGQADVAGVDLQSAQAIAKLTKNQIEQLKKLVGEGFVLDFTDQIRQQNAEMANSAQIIGLRNKLQLEGQRPEYIEGEIKKAEVAQRIAQENDAARQALERLTAAGEGGSDEAGRLNAAMISNNYQLSEFKRLTDEATAAQIAFNDTMRFRQDMNVGAGLREGVENYVESIGTMREATAQLAQTGIKGVEDAIFSLVTTGTANFREFAAEILKQTARIIIQQLILRAVMQAIGFVGGGGGGGLSNLSAPATINNPLGVLNANGNAFAQNGIIPYAKGGIVDKPTLFKFANGGAMRTGVMGEAGPEAIIPLKRGRDGKLGVAGDGGSGGGAVTVNVSVDAQGSKVQGDAGQGNALGRAVATAVQQELIRQKRPGGLLAA